jgi:hypothetical protein
MASCARCQQSVLDHEKVTARRRDGSSVILCPSCAAELKASRQQKASAKSTAVATPGDQPTTSPSAKKKSEDKWYKTIGQGLLLLIGTLVLAYFLKGLETGTVDSFRIWWPIAVLYNSFGFWGGVACPGIISLLVLGLGIKQLIEQDGEI